MICDLIYTELLKYKRTAIPGMIILGGAMPAITGILMVLGEKPKENWETILSFSFNGMNLLSLILLSVLIGFIFAGEYQENTISILFTYPIPRFYLYMIKLIVVIIFASAVYTIFFLSSISTGLIYIKRLPSAKFVITFLKLIVTMILVNFSFMPLTILICSMVKRVIASVITGMVYVVIYMIFASTEYSLYIPVCIPAEIIKKIYIYNNFKTQDVRSIIFTTFMIFPIGFLISSIYYSKSDILK